MKKKFIATVLVGAVAAASVIGFTACGNNAPGGEVSKGEEVTAQQWAEAFAATLAADNFTIGSYVESTMKMSGSTEGEDNADMTVVTKYNISGYCDYKNGTAYSTGNITVTVSGVPEGMGEEYKNGNYKIENYAVTESNTVYMAKYNEAGSTPKEWNVETTSSLQNENAMLLNLSFSTSKDGTEAKLSTLYGAFTYDDGVYTAELWQYGNKTTVTVSIKDGYVVGVSNDVTIEESGGYFTEATKSVYNYSNFGTTTVNASSAAKNAIENYKNK